jgi:hypothetical protein
MGRFKYHAGACKRAARRAQWHKYSVRQRNQVAEHKLSIGCQRCGLWGPASVLELHHRDPKTKTFKPGTDTASPERLAAELEKCDVLCANCHRGEHN